MILLALNCQSIKYFDMDDLIRLAFKNEDALVVQQIADEAIEKPLTEEKQFANRVLLTAWQKFEQEDKTQRCSRQQTNATFFFQRLIPITACIVLLINIAIPLAIASCAYLRSKAMELLISIDEEHNSARFFLSEDETQSYVVPVEWEGTYYPAYILEGYTVAAYDTRESVYL